jgi:hypothetical protein
LPRQLAEVRRSAASTLVRAPEFDTVLANLAPEPGFTACQRRYLVKLLDLSGGARRRLGFVFAIPR